MPLWGTNKDESGDKPKFLISGSDGPKEVRLSECTGVLAAAGPSGWTMPAGGNGNVDAQREVLVAIRNMTSN